MNNKTPAPNYNAYKITTKRTIDLDTPLEINPFIPFDNTLPVLPVKDELVETDSSKLSSLEIASELVPLIKRTERPPLFRRPFVLPPHYVKSLSETGVLESPVRTEQTMLAETDLVFLQRLKQKYQSPVVRYMSPSSLGAVLAELQFQNFRKRKQIGTQRTEEGTDQPKPMTEEKDEPMNGDSFFDSVVDRNNTLSLMETETVLLRKFGVSDPRLVSEIRNHFLARVAHAQYGSLFNKYRETPFDTLENDSKKAAEFSTFRPRETEKRISNRNAKKNEQRFYSLLVFVRYVAKQTRRLFTLCRKRQELKTHLMLVNDQLQLEDFYSKVDLASECGEEQRALQTLKKELEGFVGLLRNYERKKEAKDAVFVFLKNASSPHFLETTGMREEVKWDEVDSNEVDSCLSELEEEAGPEVLTVLKDMEEALKSTDSLVELFRGAEDEEKQAVGEVLEEYLRVFDKQGKRVKLTH